MVQNVHENRPPYYVNFVTHFNCILQYHQIYNQQDIHSQTINIFITQPLLHVSAFAAIFRDTIWYHMMVISIMNTLLVASSSCVSLQISYFPTRHCWECWGCIMGSKERCAIWNGGWKKWGKQRNIKFTLQHAMKAQTGSRGIVHHHH